MHQIVWHEITLENRPPQNRTLLFCVYERQTTGKWLNVNLTTGVYRFGQVEGPGGRFTIPSKHWSDFQHENKRIFWTVVLEPQECGLLDHDDDVWQQLTDLGWICIISSWDADKQETSFYDSHGTLVKTVPAGPDSWSLEDILDRSPAINGDTIFQLELAGVEDARWLRMSKGGILCFYNAKGEAICTYGGWDFMERAFLDDPRDSA